MTARHYWASGITGVEEGVLFLVHMIQTHKTVFLESHPITRYSLGIATVSLSSFRHSFPALHIQNRAHGNLLRLQLHLMFLHAEPPSQLHLIRVMISSGANVTPSGTIFGSNILEGHISQIHIPLDQEQVDRRTVLLSKCLSEGGTSSRSLRKLL